MVASDSCYRFIVSGRVQGVFFRDSTRNRALKLGLRGWVRNRYTGDVELMAVGSEAQIRRLEQWLWQGPELASVTNVAVEKLSQPDDVLKSFDIRRTVSPRDSV